MKILAICGKSAAGKDTLLRKLVDKYPNVFHEIVSCTTRPPREGEVDGVNYHFLSKDEFAQKILNLDMLEATCFNDWYYGTPQSSLKENKVNVGVFNPEGLDILLDSSALDIDIAYVTCNDKERLIRQLTRELNPNVPEIIRRYGTDEKDFGHIHDLLNRATVDYEIQNDSSVNSLSLSTWVDVLGQHYLNYIE